MREFIARQNIAHYHDQLKFEKEPGKRTILLKLLAEEEALMAAFAAQHDSFEQSGGHDPAKRRPHIFLNA